MASISEEALVALRKIAQDMVNERGYILEETAKLESTARFMEGKIEIENLPEIIKKLHITLGKLDECIGKASEHINEVAEAYEDVIRFMAKL